MTPFDGPNSNVLDLLDEIERTPGMWMSRSGLTGIEDMLHGYYVALSIHGLDDGVPALNHDFREWIYAIHGWSMSSGWAYGLEHVAKVPDPLRRFLSLAREFIGLRRWVIACATPSAVTPGKLDGETKGPFEATQPRRVAIVQIGDSGLRYVQVDAIDGTSRRARKGNRLQHSVDELVDWCEVYGVPRTAWIFDGQA